MKSKTIYSLDLTQHPPRSPRVRLGGYAILARCLDKGRALLADKNGEYNYDCPLDQRVLEFAGIKGNDLKKQLALGKSDSEILVWINANSTTKPQPWQIAQWSAFAEQRGPNDVETREFFTGLLATLSKDREDILGWFDLLDLDDYVSFGGKA
jgi:Domain of unknown function (DUF5069)